MAITYVEKMAALESAFDVVAAARLPFNQDDGVSYRFYDALFQAIGAGWDNADDTMRDERETPDAERRAYLAYNSICCTSIFEERSEHAEAVRAWFKANGYVY